MRYGEQETQSDSAEPLILLRTVGPPASADDGKLIPLAEHEANKSRYSTVHTKSHHPVVKGDPKRLQRVENVQTSIYRLPMLLAIAVIFVPQRRRKLASTRRKCADFHLLASYVVCYRYFCPAEETQAGLNT